MCTDTNVRHPWRWVALWFTLAGWDGVACAAPLFIERVNAARPTAEALAKAREAIVEHKDVTLRAEPKVPPFHKRTEPPLAKGEAYCQGCHLPLPHTKKLRTRAFLNMHSRYVACESCHFRPEDVRFEFRWLDYAAGQSVPPAPGRLRTGVTIDNSVVLDGRVKIAPFHLGERALALPGDAFAEQVARDWKAATTTDAKAEIKARLHAPLSKEGPACEKCHSAENSLLDFAALGASPVQAMAIQRHVIPQFFGRYKDENERIRILDILR